VSTPESSALNVTGKVALISLSSSFDGYDDPASGHAILGRSSSLLSLFGNGDSGIRAMIAVVATLHGDRDCDFKLWQAPPEVDKHVILKWMVVFQHCVYKWVESGLWLASCS
jgi:hypothetical protein